MSLPRQIQEQADRAEEIEKTMAGQPAGDSPTPQEPLPKDQQAAPPAPPQPEAPQAKPEPAPAPPAPAAKDTEETWEQRYRSLQGAQRAEASRLGARISELEGLLTQTNARLLELTKTPPKPEPAAPLPISDKDKAEFGPEIIDLIQRQSSHIAAQATAEIKAENDSLKKQLADVGVQLKGVSTGQEEQRRQAYFSRLAQLVPDWEAVNADQRLMDWLALPDPASGAPRQQYLTTAWINFDADRTAYLFNAWKDSLSPSSSARQPDPLAAHASPSSSRSSAPRVTEPDVKVWSQRDIDAFYTDVTRGKINGADVTRIEAEIDAAVATGRVR
jgi:hypothetical protein